jgi:hypothetical protein
MPRYEVAWSPRRSTAAQRPTAQPSRPATVTTRRPGGTRRGRVSSGSSLRWAKRRDGTARRQRSPVGSISHGASSLNAPSTRSAGGPASPVAGSWTGEGVDAAADVSVMGRVSHRRSGMPPRRPRTSWIAPAGVLPSRPFGL